MGKNLIRKLWFDARFGHSNYLMFLLALVNFILITYNFLLEGNDIFNEMFSNVWVFGLIFGILYVPISVLIGRWHTFNQLKIEWEMKMFEDPVTAKMIKGLLDVKTGKASEEEIKEFRKFVKKIEDRDIHEF